MFYKAGEVMKKYFISRIEWIPLEKGGRRSIPPEGTRYCPIIRLDEEEKKSWRIDFVCPNINKTAIIEFFFFSDDAPIEKIQINKAYDLYEGSKMVARIYIQDKKTI